MLFCNNAYCLVVLYRFSKEEPTKECPGCSKEGVEVAKFDYDKSFAEMNITITEQV